ncbi:hypothetical protein QQ045_030257 [Rhodiola kirilowii]
MVESQCQLVEDPKKRKRMESNKESSRRCRAKKHKRLHDLMMQLTEAKTDKIRVSSSLSEVCQHYSIVESENFVLRAQVLELSDRLQYLIQNLTLISSNNNALPSFHEDHQLPSFP